MHLHPMYLNQMIKKESKIGRLRVHCEPTMIDANSIDVFKFSTDQRWEKDGVTILGY
jgi:hypothetical protein